MEHSEAIEMKAAERYVLGDLSVSEVEEFERHFFDCPQCSEELRMLSVLQENARAVFAEPTPGPRTEPAASLPVRPDARESWWSRLATIWRQPWAIAPALAAIGLAILIGYQTGLRRGSDGPQSVSAFPLFAASRGEETVVAPPRSSEFYTLYMDRTWERDYESYTASLRRDSSGNDASGSEQFSMKLGAVPMGKSIQVLVPKRSLQPGNYVLVITGSDGSQLARYPFRLQFE